MKLWILTAIIAAVASSPLTQGKGWPWQVGKEYLYDVNTYTWTQYDVSNSNGNTFKAQFIIRVLAPGQLVAKLNKPLYAQIQGEKITYDVLPSNLKYQSVPIPDEPFEIFVDGGRVKSFNIPAGLSLVYENLLKGLIGALQVDLSAYGHVETFPNSYDKETFQGLFKKMESDVTGDCETLYTVSPLSAEWRRELPQFASEEDPIEIIKSKNYSECKERVDWYYGVPEGALWRGIAQENEEKQFIKHTSEVRMIAGKQGTIYKSDVISSVSVAPLLFGKQKAEVYSYVSVTLSSIQDISGAKWKKAAEGRQVDSLLYTPFNETMFYPKDGPQNIALAQKLLQEMTPMLQDPNNLPKADFLSKFNILVRVIGVLNSEQLAQLTSSIEIAKSSKNVAKTGMWTIYRDAVAQSGFIPGFDEIKSWIFAKKVQGEEAAQLVSEMGASLRFPSKKVNAKFFELMTNPEILDQQFLNNSVLLTATRYFRNSKDRLYVVDTVISHLAKELKQAVDNEDSKKAQVYIRALGNLAYPEVLKVFAPYLDGSIAVSKYLRIQIVGSLKTLANLKNEYVRAVLFSILKNTAEPYDVRVIAALNIFMAFPTAEMMKLMAYMANNDPSTQVRAVLANSIAFAAKLKDPRFAELAKTAQAVEDMVAKEKYGYRYSTDSLIDEYTSDDDIAFFRELSYIGSEDHILPKYHRAALRSRGTGWTEENQLTLSVSDVQQLVEYIASLVYQPSQSKVDVKFSAKEIAEKLNIKREPRVPLEGALFLENLNQQKLITFSEADLKAFIASTVKNLEQLFNGVDVQYTKVVNHKQVYVVFPLAAGVPFIFGYNEPLIYSAHGQVQIKLAKGKAFDGSLNKQLDITYARNMEGSVGFLDTLGDVYAIAGVTNKIQFHIPANLKTAISPGEVKLNFVLPEKDANLVHLSVWPYTSLVNKDSLLTISENPATKYIERPTKVVNTDFKFGHLTGVGLYLQGYSYSSDFKDTKAFDGELLTSIGNLMYQKDVALTQFDFKYIAKESKNKEVTFDLFYDTLFNQKQSGEMGPASLIKDVSDRRQELVKRAAAGIDSAAVQVYDISAIFDGKQKIEYVFTAAIADSHVDNKFQGAFFFNAGQQINAVFKLVKPKIVPLNFEEALKNKIKVTYEVDFKFGNSDNVNLQGFGERSEQYTELLSNDPLAKQCLQETSKHNLYQLDCHKMIIKAHAPDYFKATVTYKKVSPSELEFSYGLYQSLKQLYSWDEEEDFTKFTEDGKLEIEAQAFYYDQYINYEFTSKNGALRLNNVEGMYYYPYAMAVYAPISSWERSRNWFTGYQNLPYCAVDNSKVWTFSGRSYNYSLSSSWHVVMVDESDDLGKWTDLVVLARRPNNNQEEVYISYKTETGKYVELDIKPSSVEIKSNAKKVSEGALTTYWNDDEEAPLLEYYTLADGVQVFSINNKALRVVYDNQRLVIFTDDHRSTTRGICGQSSSEIRDDYKTPYGIVDLPEYYGASFSLDGEFSDPKTAEMKKEAKLKAYKPVIKYTNVFRSDAEWTKAHNYSKKEL